MARSERFPLMFSPAEIGAIDDMRFRERIGSRAEAIRQLIERGLRSSVDSAAVPPDGRYNEGEKSNADEGGPGSTALVGVSRPATGGPSHDQR